MAWANTLAGRAQYKVRKINGKAYMCGMEPRLITAVRLGLSETRCSTHHCREREKKTSIDHTLHKCLKRIDLVRNCLYDCTEEMPRQPDAKSLNMFSNSHCCHFKYLSNASSINHYSWRHIRILLLTAIPWWINSLNQYGLLIDLVWWF